MSFFRAARELLVCRFCGNEEPFLGDSIMFFWALGFLFKMGRMSFFDECVSFEAFAADFYVFPRMSHVACSENDTRMDWVKFSLLRH